MPPQEPKLKKGVVVRPCRIQENEKDEIKSRIYGDIIETTETHLRELIAFRKVEEYNGLAKPGTNIKGELEKKAAEAKKAADADK